MSQALVPQNILMVSENKLKNFTDIDPNVTSSVLLPFVSVVQQTKLEYIIGGKYYRQLLDQISGSTLTDINNNFLQYFCQPLLIWAAYREALPSIFMRIKNNGIVNGSENTVTMKEMEWMYNRADDRSQFFEQRLIDEVIYNSGNYPLCFNYNTSDGLFPHLGKNYFSGLQLTNGGRRGTYDMIPRGMPVFADPTFMCCGF
jgi:hypothetical protein